MPGRRDVVRDVVRGLTILEMSFFNISSLAWTQHSGWIDQPAYADTIFPCFAFLAGMSPIPARRSIGLVGLGLAVQTLETYAFGAPMRYPGVLQRHGFASFLANTSSLLGCLQSHVGVSLLLLWLVISFSLGDPSNPFAHPNYRHADPFDTAQTRIDTFLFHESIYTPTYDPEGVLGGLTTALSMLAGQSFAEHGCNYTDLQKMSVALGLIGTGEALYAWSPRYFPISKSLWTPSFVLIMAGTSILKFLILQKLVDILPRPLIRVLEAVGRRSLEIYLTSTLLESLLRYNDTKSLWNYGVSGLARYTTRSVADFTLSLLYTGSMAFTAVFMVIHRIKITW